MPNAETTPQVPPPPARPMLEPATSGLVGDVRRALEALPARFETDVRISGMPLPDLFTLNSGLGATIERETVRTLNDLRAIWDPTRSYDGFRFIRYSESFPDVRLEGMRDGVLTTLLGIELKGWFILSKEEEPSFRYTISRACCADADLLCVVPWYLDGAIDGTPQVLSPFVESARYVAEVRNYWWQHIRKGRGGSADINPPPGEPHPYPKTKKHSNDRPVSDGGNNFGRIARVGTVPKVGLLDSYVTSALATELAGVPASHWLKFLLAITETDTETELAQRLSALRSVEHPRSNRKDIVDRVLEALLADEDDDRQ